VLAAGDVLRLTLMLGLVAAVAADGPGRPAPAGTAMTEQTNTNFNRCP
jgi:hypothetical protein